MKTIKYSSSMSLTPTHNLSVRELEFLKLMAEERIKYSSLKSLAPTHNLSVRELEFLKLMAEGQSNPEIAAHLYLSHNTIKTHVRGIFNKLGVDHRVQAAVVALRQGLI